MQTRLPIIPLEECVQIYGQRAHISNANICTLDTTRRRCTCIGDLGGPLVYGNGLLGIMSDIRGKKFGEDPDVFISLNYPEIHEWVTNIINNNFRHEPLFHILNREIVWILRGNTTVNARKTRFFQEFFLMEGKGIQV